MFEQPKRTESIDQSSQQNQEEQIPPESFRRRTTRRFIPLIPKWEEKVRRDRYKHSQKDLTQTKTPEQIQEWQRKAALLAEMRISQKTEEIGELKKTAKGVLDAYMESSVGEKIATPALLVGLLIYGTLYVPFKMIMYAVKKMDSKAASDFDKTYKSVYEFITGKDKKGKGKGGGKQKEIPKLTDEELEIRTIEALHRRLNEDRAAALARNEFTIEDQKEYETNLRALRSRERITGTLTQEDEKQYEEEITQSRNELVEKNIWTEEQKNQYIKDLEATEKREKEEEAKKIVQVENKRAREKRLRDEIRRANEQYDRENPRTSTPPQNQPEDNKSTEETPES